MKKVIALFLCLALIFCLGACAREEKEETTENVLTEAVTETTEAPTEAEADLWAKAQYTEDTDLGEGATAFVFKVSAEDKTVTFNISTDKATVGEALQELGLIEGENGEYGLMVNVVDGISADYNADGFYWAFYVGADYATKGIDQTDIEAGAEYSMVRTAAE